MKIWRLSFVHLSDVLGTEVAGARNLVGSVASRVRLVEGGGSTEHGTQLACLIVLGSGGGPGIVVACNLSIELRDNSCHWGTVS